MNLKEFTKTKNVLDLKHSEVLSRGITELSISMGGFIGILLSIYNKNLLIAIVIASIFALMFLTDGIAKLNYCRIIRDEIKKLS